MCEGLAFPIRKKVEQHNTTQMVQEANSYNFTFDIVFGWPGTVIMTSDLVRLVEQNTTIATWKMCLTQSC